MRKWGTDDDEEEGSSHRFHIHHKVAFTRKVHEHTTLLCLCFPPNRSPFNTFHSVWFSVLFPSNACMCLSSNQLILFRQQSNFGSFQYRCIISWVLTCRLFSLQLFRIWYAKWFFNISRKNNIDSGSNNEKFELSIWRRCIDYKLTSIAILPFSNGIALHARPDVCLAEVPHRKKLMGI